MMRAARQGGGPVTSVPAGEPVVGRAAQIARLPPEIRQLKNYPADLPTAPRAASAAYARGHARQTAPAARPAA